MAAHFGRIGGWLAAALVAGLLLGGGAAAQPADTDGDGVPDWCDNCRTIDNPSQRNSGDPTIACQDDVCVGTGAACEEDEDCLCQADVCAFTGDPCDIGADCAIGTGNACDGDFDDDGFVSIADFNLFLPDFHQGQGNATDMDDDGVVSIADFNRFLPQFQQGQPGPGSDKGQPVDSSGTGQGACWADRVGLPRPIRSAGGSSDGCSLTAAELAAVDLSLFGIPSFPLDGNVNNPTDHVVRTVSGGLAGCPNAAFGSFQKRDLATSDVCGFQVPSVVCGPERTGLPCFGDVCTPLKQISCTSDADCPAGLSCYQGDAGGVCNPTTPMACGTEADCDVIGTLPLKDPNDPSKGNQEWKCHAMNCGDALNGFACESHDSCGALCGYRKFQCDDEFRDHLFATCYALEGQEKDLCQSLCLTFATAYADAKDPVFQDDDGTWTPFDYGEQDEQCRCCTNLVADLDLPSKADDYASSQCGDGFCDPETESCLLRSCPSDCGSCGSGDFCVSDADCPGLACVNGACGKLPALTPCDQDSQCRSDNCGILGFCVDVCGDGFCDGTEICSAIDFPPLACTTDCGKCGAGQSCLIDSDCQSDICILARCVSAGSLSDGQICNTNDACQSGICNAGFCIGSPQPAGSVCTTDGACISDNCAGVCIQSCGDGSCDGTERCGAADQGLACNTDCSTCSNGEICAVDADCTSGLCTAGFCVATGLPDGSVCVSNGQCTSGLCNAGICLPPGSVPNGLPCTSNAACSSSICNAGFCIGSPLNAGSVCTTDLACYSGNCIGVCAQSCGDNQCDGTELCGGSNSGLKCNTDCGTCPNGSTCTSGSDCNSGFCAGLICANPPPFCGDGSCNGTEICGNSNSGLECNDDCGKCSNGSFCTTNSDCSSGRCEAFVCRACKNTGLCDEDSDCCDGSCNITISGPRC